MFTMSRFTHLIGGAALIVFGLTSPATGSSRIPDVAYEKHPGAVLDEAPYISGFECLVHGEKYGRPVCDYYKAVLSSPLTTNKTSEGICFKELTPVSIPREYKAETIYRFIIETDRHEHDGFVGTTLARILSKPADVQTLWYETTTVALYDCDVPYDEQSSDLGVRKKMDPIERLSKTHNIPILDNELNELVQLRAEEKKLQGEMQVAVMKMIVRGEINSAALVEGMNISGEMIDKLPKDVLLRMFEVNQRIEDIEAPFQAADKADKIRKEMTKLSETSGAPIPLGEIEETIALNAEKDKIQKRIGLETVRKWRLEGGLLSAVQKALPNAEDDVRLKEIEARLKAIYAPMAETK
jgi:hypothetical protein